MQVAKSSRAPFDGVVVGLVPFAVAAAAQLALAVVDLHAEPGADYALGLVVLPLLTGLALLAPVRRSRWPLTARRAGWTGLAWLVGLPWPAWLFLGQLLPAIASVAGVSALLGAAVGWAGSR